MKSTTDIHGTNYESSIDMYNINAYSKHWELKDLRYAVQRNLGQDSASHVNTQLHTEQSVTKNKQYRIIYDSVVCGYHAPNFSPICTRNKVKSNH